MTKIYRSGKVGKNESDAPGAEAAKDDADDKRNANDRIKNIRSSSGGEISGERSTPRTGSIKSISRTASKETTDGRNDGGKKNRRNRNGSDLVTTTKGNTNDAMDSNTSHDDGARSCISRTTGTVRTYAED